MTNSKVVIENAQVSVDNNGQRVTYKGKEYVFDPCLQILCEKKYYNKIFVKKYINWYKY